jgi:hypothetical protein
VRADDDGDVEAELRCDQLRDVAGDVVRPAAAREQDVPALQVGRDVVVACVGEGVAELRHRHTVVRPDVHAP